MVKNIILAFIPLFVAVDAIGTLPIFVSLTQPYKKRERARVIFQSMVTAICLATGFVFLGKFVFRMLNITVGDFMVGGGVVLFCIAIIDIVNPTKKQYLPSPEVGAVPLGTPLIVGPAVLTTSLIVLDQHGLVPTLIAALGNVIIAGIIFSSSNILMKALGASGARALSKIMSLLLAAIAVMMIRRGILYILTAATAAAH